MALPKILIADDNHQDVFLAREAISDLGMPTTVLVAYDGLQAMEGIDLHKPDVVLLDLKMPRMNGMEVLAKLKSYTNKPYIIVLTTSDSAKEIKEAMELGADAYMVKPFEAHDFEAKISAIKAIFIRKDFEFVKFKKNE